MSNFETELRQAVLEALEQATTPQTPPAPDPTRAAPIGISEAQLAAMGLSRAEGISVEAAALRVVQNGVEGYAEVIEAERQRRQSIADRDAAAKYAASPEGRAAQAERIRAEQEALTRRDNDARTLLKAGGQFDSADIEAMSAEERARAAGLVADNTPPDTIEASLERLSDSERAWLRSGASFNNLNPNGDS